MGKMNWGKSQDLSKVQKARGKFVKKVIYELNYIA